MPDGPRSHPCGPSLFHVSALRVSIGYRMSFLATVGAITIGLIGLAISLLICAVIWGYAQAAGGYIRAITIARRYGITLWKRDKPKPRFFALRMIHWQAWHSRNWEFGGLLIPWTFTERVRRAKRFYGA